MADVFVDDTATGANDGTAWSDAYTDILSCDGAGSSAGDVVKIKDTHTRNPSANTTMDFTGASAFNPIYIISVAEGANDDGTADTYSKGALIADLTVGYDFTIDGHVYMAGCIFRSAAVGTQCFCGGFRDDQYFYDCEWDFNGGGTFDQVTVDSFAVFELCVFDLGNFQLNNGAFCRCYGCTFDCSYTSGSVRVSADFVDAHFYGCDFSACGGSKVVDNYETLDYIYLYFHDCELQAAASNCDDFTTGQNSRIVFENCSAATITGDVVRFSEVIDSLGRITQDTTTYRAAANIGGNDYSLKFAPNTNVDKLNYRLLGQPMAVHVGASATKLTMYVTCASTLDDSDCGFYVLSPNEVATTKATAKYRATQSPTSGVPDPLRAISNGANSPTGLTSTTGEWTSAKTYQYKFDVTIAPDEQGFAYVIPWVGRDVDIWFCPAIDVT